MRRGFALVEMLIATAIIGFSVVAILVLVSSQTRSLSVTSEISQAIHLANNVHEFALSLPLMAGPRSSFTDRPSNPKDFSNLCALDGWNSGTGGPINSDANRIAGLPGWKQSCVVNAFDLENPGTLYVAGATETNNDNARKLTVTVTRDDKVLYVCSWILAPTVQF